MQVFQDVFYEQDEHVIVGFINTQHELEYSIYKYNDGGTFPLEDKECTEQEFTDLLEIELKDFIKRNMPTLFILGHEIYLELVNGEDISRYELDEEVYEISHSIMQGDEHGEVFIESKNVMSSWKIIK